MLSAVVDPLAPAEPARASGTWTVDRPAGAAPRTVFRRLLTLRFADPGPADRVVVGDAVRLDGRFFDLDLEPLTRAEPEHGATVSAGPSDSILVEIAAVRQVAAVRMEAAGLVARGDRVELYRVDGEALAAAPTATLPARKERSPSRRGLAARRERGGTAAPPAPPFADRRFGLRLLRAGGRPALVPGDLRRLVLRGLPTGARLGLAPAGRPEEAISFWRADGEVDEAEVAAGAALAAELQRQLDAALAARREAARTAGATGGVELALVVESDAPCRFRLDRLAVPYLLEIASFPDGDGRRTLRFSGARSEDQAVPLRQPPGAAVVAAEVTLRPSLGDQRLGSPAADLAPLDASRGLLLGADRAGEQAVELAAPATVSGVALAVWPLRTGGELRVEIHADRDGAPAGRPLAAGTVRPGAAGEPMWVVAGWPEPVILSTARHWLVARAAAGEAVWLGEEAGAAGALRIAGPGGAREAAGFAGAHRLRTRAAADGEEEPLSVAIGGAAASATISEDGGRGYDLTALLAASGARELTVRSALAGTVAVSPPRIRYLP